MSLPKAAVLQMNSQPDCARNLDSLETLALAAANEGASLVVAPECASYLGPEDGKFEVAEHFEDSGPVLTRYKAIARKASVELVSGFWEKGPSPDKVFNACVHINKDGNLVEVYRKIHLFDVDLPDGSSHRESAGIEPGRDVVVTETAVGSLGLSVCYDVRFPELYRKLVDEGAELLAVPSAFTLTTGKEHWHVLLRARAIESQCYVLAAAQTGLHYANRVSYGHALIADPWGAVVAECSEGEGFAIASIDLARVKKVRLALPSLSHRRLS